MPRVFILILHWEKYEITKSCLESFRKLDYPNFKIVVLDNASKNDSAQRLQKEFPEAIFIFNKENKGYGAGMNPGIKYALNNGADYIFLLNNDVIVSQPDFLKKLINFMESNEKVGITGPKLLFLDGSYQKSYNYFFLAMALELYWPAKFTKILKKLHLIQPKDNMVHKVAWLNAVALLFKKQVFEDIGLMDERFFLGAEDIDLSLRAKRKGWETFYCPFSELIHISFISHEKPLVAYDKFYIESTIRFLYKSYMKPLAYLLQFLMAGGFFIRGIEWSIKSIFDKSNITVAKEFFKLTSLIFKVKV